MDRDLLSLTSNSKSEADERRVHTSAPEVRLVQNLPAPSQPHNISVSRLTEKTFLPFRRVTSLLLPIRYPDSFFKEAISDPTISSISRVALYRDSQLSQENSVSNSTTHDRKSTTEHVIGGIRCRLEPLPVPPNSTPLLQQQMYIQTLVLLSPYRGRGIATLLLDTVVCEAVKCSDIVTSVYAHVWEANQEGLEWYIKRGFTVEEIQVGYYKRLKPGGARVVRRMIGVSDHLRASGAGLSLSEP